MGHHALKSAYQRLSDRINRFPQGAPPTKLLFEILKLLFSEREAELVSILPIKPFTPEKAAKIWKLSLTETQKILDELAGRAVLVDIWEKNQQTYTLPPPMAGFFEFSMMRIRTDINQKLLGELYYQYLNVEEDFIKALFVSGETQMGRIYVNESVLTNDNALAVLDYERSSMVINDASHIGISVCYCRHKMQHVGKDCDNPMDICMSFNLTARSLIKYGHARSVDAVECLELLQLAYEKNLLQFGENARRNINFICNCCGCCCEALIAARQFGLMNPVHTTNFIPVVESESCKGCGKCVIVCPVEAMSLISTNDPHFPKKKRAKLDERICLGCGVCVRVCPDSVIALKSRPERVITPLNATHRAVVMAIERGNLQDLMFDNRVLWYHRALAAVFGVILRLPPIKQIMATRQVKSRYLEALIDYWDPC